ncbi:hypothetical protein PMIN06_010621 [Paraphaeosphaeria minitans]|uniref:PI31 proteasome regulator n=1 Tax=Paraphaeosphaeria minitans TaxID=565426 RepID=A0A9P6GQC6_9PLEO|nr:PI31 proteasome regulator [Paraphaeosphaeria minitans]
MPPANSAGSPLGAASLSTFMAASLPKSAESKVNSAYEAVALAAHAGMIAVGFRLIGLGEDDKIDASADAENPQPLPTAWNVHNSYAFRYAHSQSALEYIIKVNRLGGKAVVFGLGVGDDKTATFDVAIKDYISEGSLPVSASHNTPVEDLAKKLQDVFISQGRLSDFGALLKLSIIQKLAPGLDKEGYENTRIQDERDADHVREQPRQGEPSQPRRPPEDPEPARPFPFVDPLAQPRHPGRPLPEPMPGFEDEYEITRPPRGGLRDDRQPGGYGHNDLYPQGLGPYDPLRPHFGGGLPRPGGMGGGMHPTFDDPMFGGQGGGQGGYDPMAPPGSRYDPVGPGGAPRDNRGGPRFPGGGGFGGLGGAGGRPPNSFGGYGDGDFI